MIPSSTYQQQPDGTTTDVYLHIRLIHRLTTTLLTGALEEFYQILLLHNDMEEDREAIFHQWKKSKQPLQEFLEVRPSAQLSLFAEEDPRTYLQKQGKALLEETDPKEWLRLLEAYIPDFTIPAGLYQSTSLPELAFRAEELVRNTSILIHQPWEAPLTETAEYSDAAILPRSHYPHTTNPLTLHQLTSKRTSSYSQLSTLMECPYQFRLKYDFRISESYNPKAHLGTLLHLVIERFYEDAPYSSPTQAERVFEQLLQQVLPAIVPDDWVERINQVTSFFLTKVYTPEVTPLVHEHPFRYHLDNVTFKGRIDRIDETSEGLHIYDYKSGVISADPIETQLQLGLYSLVVQEDFGNAPVAVSYIYLSQGETQTHKVTDEWMEDMQQRLQELTITLQTPWRAPTPNPTACNRCSYHSICIFSQPL